MRKTLITRSLRYTLLLLSLAGFLSWLTAQTRWRPDLQKPNFTRFSVAEGLSQSGINCMLHDSRGFMWFGTQDGLNCFDGYNFRVFKHIDGDSSSISQNWIWTIHEGENADLWIGTFGGGLNRFDRQTERFSVYRQLTNASDIADINSPRAILQLQPGRIWLGLDLGFASFDFATRNFRHFRPNERRNYLNLNPDSVGRIQFMFQKAMAVFDPQTELYTETKFLFPGDKTNHKMTSICARRSGGYWLGSDQSAVFYYLPETQRLVDVTSSSLRANLQGQPITHLLEDHDGVLWIGTSAGLILWSTNSLGAVASLKFESGNPKSISHNLVTAIYENRHHELWVGTRKGLNFFSKTAQKFVHLQPNQDNPQKSLSNAHVLPIYEDSQQRIWIGSGNGLNLYDPLNNLFTQYYFGTKGRSAVPGHNYVLSIGEDNNGALWLGTRGSGARRFEPDKNRSQTFPFFKQWQIDINSRNINSVYRTQDGVVWLGGGGGGLNRYLPESESFKQYLRDPADSSSISNNWVFAMLEDRENRFWLGTAAGGINLFDREKQRFQHFLHDPENPASLSSNMVLCMYQAVNGTIWIGTANGLNKMTVKQFADGRTRCVFENFYEQDGLPNNVIYGILEDDDGRLWISTNHGLSRMTWDGIGAEFRNYSQRDGLQSDEFNQNAYLRASDGRFYFGGINGLNWFYPDSIRDNPFVPPVIISDFRIFNESVPLSEKIENDFRVQSATRLKRAISETEQIDLSWRDKVFSFEFAALNFSEPQQNHYAYKLDGFDREWIYSGTRRFVTYTNLDPGDYVFRVKAANNDGVWNNEDRIIYLSIAPPPWQTWWAYLLYLLMFSGLLLALIRFQVRKNAAKIEAQARIERVKTEERERVRKQSSSDFHDEAGNLITRINLYLELTRRNIADNPQVVEYIDHIEENTKSLSGGMRDFIWVLDPEQDSLYDTIERLQQFGNAMFTHSDAHFSVKGQKKILQQHLLPPKDRRAIVLIFKEAMNNCLKYATAGRVQLIVSLEKEHVKIILQDDGVGFKQKASDGYGLKNMKSRAEKISGTVTIDSIVGQGTSVIFRK